MKHLMRLDPDVRQAQGSNVKAEQVVAINEERAADETADEAEEICSLNAK